jgi:hypothetical protein
MRKVIFTTMALLFVAGALAQAQQVEFSGQFRGRSEFDDRSFNEGRHHDVFHLLRMRLAATATLNDRVNVVVEVQDARTFGGSGGTLNMGASAFDLRQGYVEVTGCMNDALSFRLGRQSLSYGNERLIGAIDWNNFSQSFDAGVLRLHAGDMQVDAIGAALGRNPITGSYVRDFFLAGLWGAWTPAATRTTVQAFWLFDNPDEGNVRQNRHTAGVYAGGHAGMLDFEVDAALQFGDHIMTGMESHHISANMVGVRVGYRFPELAGLRIGAGVDRLSGNDPDKDDTFGAFNTLYGTNHKYYGYMDYFNNVQLTTMGMGLMDIIGQVSIAPAKDVWLGIDVHLFSTVTDPDKVLPANASNRSATIGTEIDFTARWKMADAVNLTAGFSVFMAENERAVLRAAGAPTENTSWGYIMTTVNF